VLRNTTNAANIANALSSYFTATSNANTSGNPGDTLTPYEIDAIMANINDVNLTLNTFESILVAQQPDQGDGVIVLGASFNRDYGGQVVKNNNKNQMLSMPSLTAAVISPESLVGVTSLNMLIIDKPTAYERPNAYTGKRLASSVVVASVTRNSSHPRSMNIALYFSILKEYEPYVDAEYLCSFYDQRTNEWHESGCTKPIRNGRLNRFECHCDHLTTFALTWIPRTRLTISLHALDIALIVSQSISILCFLIVLVHALITRVHAHQLIPLISMASSSTLFIFYIASVANAFTGDSHAYKAECFTSASVLIFLIYFFLILMFCTKLSVCYFGYRRFVWPSSKSTFRKLVVMLVISFFFSSASVACAAILDSHSSFDVTELYAGKICWFTESAVYFFFTIPLCVFLFLCLVLLIMFAVRIIQCHRTVRTNHRSRSYAQMKWCALVLLASFVTQGTGWLLGSITSWVSLAGGNVFGWIFVVCNGLEGVWSIVLYLIIRSGRVNELDQRQVAETPNKATRSIPNAPMETSVANIYHGSYVERTESERNYNSIHEDTVAGNADRPNPSH
jgi:hypothetical protein